MDSRLQPQSRLLGLPGELLNNITTRLFYQPDTVQTFDPSGRAIPHALARTCRQLRKHYHQESIDVARHCTLSVVTHIYNFDFRPVLAQFTWLAECESVFARASTYRTCTTVVNMHLREDWRDLAEGGLLEYTEFDLHRPIGRNG